MKGKKSNCRVEIVLQGEVLTRKSSQEPEGIFSFIKEEKVGGSGSAPTRGRLNASW